MTSLILKPEEYSFADEYCSTPEETERVNKLIKEFGDEALLEPPEVSVPRPESIPEGFCFDPFFGLRWISCHKCGQDGDHLTEECDKPFDCPEVVIFSRKMGIFSESYMEGLEKRVAEKLGLKDLKDYKVDGAKCGDELTKQSRYAKNSSKGNAMLKELKTPNPRFPNGGVSGNKVSLTKECVTSGDVPAKQSWLEKKRKSSKAKAMLKQFKPPNPIFPDVGVSGSKADPDFLTYWTAGV